MSEKTAYMLEAESRDKGTGMTSIGDDLPVILGSLQEWMNKCELLPGDLRYAWILRLADLAKVADLQVEDGQLVLVPRKVLVGKLLTPLRELRLSLRFWLIARRGGDIRVKHTREDER